MLGIWLLTELPSKSTGKALARHTGRRREGGEGVRKDEITQITSALPGWYAYGKDADGREFLSPIVCWALVESSAGGRYVQACTHTSGNL
jgi:hypothetical protein